MSTIPSARLNRTLALADMLEIPAVALARELRRRMQPKPQSRGATLRPGTETSLWNALAEAVAPHLRRRGEKIRLARVLGLHPARMHEFFIARTAMPDAERTLFLLLWLDQKRQGRDKGQ
jgi:hypothetical protein